MGTLKGSRSAARPAGWRRRRIAVSMFVSGLSWPMLPALPAAADDVAYVDSAIGKVTAALNGRSSHVTALDMLSTDQAVILPRGTSLRVCHFGVRTMFELAGPLNAIITATGLADAFGVPLRSTGLTCNEPAVAVLQGGAVFRRLQVSDVILSQPAPRIRIAVKAGALKTASIEDNATGNVVNIFREGLALQPRLQPGRIYRVVVELEAGAKRSILLRVAEEREAQDNIILVVDP